MAKQDEVHQLVTDAYTHAVTDETKGESECCCSAPVQKGVAAKLAGYTREELDALPPEAVTNSFGCGNPLAFMDLAEGDVVLDLGSGAGIDILLAAKKVGPTGRAIGVDMTDAMLTRARENIAAAGLPNVEVRKGTIENLPVGDGSVDWVISNCVINLSPDKPKVFAEIARVLKPGGRLRVSDIVAEQLPDTVRQNAALHACCIAGAISEPEYIEGLRQAGLTDVEVRERLVYDADHLRGLVQSEIAGLVQTSACCDMSTNQPELGEICASLAGKVWSAMFHARKP
jgi:SAM-dependent methyltransferase